MTDTTSEGRARFALEGRTYWVVGAGGGGIGTAISLALAQEGAHVLAVDRDDTALDATIDGAAELPGRIERRVVDATERDAVETLVAAQTREGVRPAGLVSVVGGLLRDEFARTEHVDDATFDAVLDRNLRPAWLFSQVFAQEAIADGREVAIVHLSSIAALQGMPYGAAYAMAKAALVSLARTQAIEWGPRGVRVNTIAGGTIRTPRSTDTDPELDRRVLPLGRRGTTRDIANAALFLLSDLASWITGEVLAVDGGASIKPSYLDDTGLSAFVQDDAIRARLRDPSG